MKRHVNITIPNADLLTAVDIIVSKNHLALAEHVFVSRGRASPNFEETHIRKAILSKSADVFRLLLYRVMPTYAPRLDTSVHNRLVFLSMLHLALVAQCWKVVKVLTDLYLSPVFWPEHLHLDRRIAWNGTQDYWDELYNRKIVGVCLGLTLRELRSHYQRNLLDYYAELKYDTLLGIASVGRLASLKALAARGNVDLSLVRDHSNGFTLMLAACSNGHSHVVRWLFGKGCTLRDRTYDGRSMMDLATASQDRQLIIFLRQYISPDPSHSPP